MNNSITRWILLFPLSLAALVGCGEGEPERTDSPVRINEVNPDNPVYQDMVGGTEDWIELYNGSDAEVSLEGYYISDSANSRFKDQFVAGTVIAPRGVLLVWADAETNQSSARAPHVSFKLSSTGEGVWLSNPDGYVVDKIQFAKIPVNPTGGQWTSFARFPDGSGNWAWCSESTPDESNGNACLGSLL